MVKEDKFQIIVTASAFALGIVITILLFLNVSYNYGLYDYFINYVGLG